MDDALHSPYAALVRSAFERSADTDEPVLSFLWPTREIRMDLNGESFDLDADAFLALVEQVAPPWWPRYRQAAVERITAASDTTLPASVPISPTQPESDEPM